MMSGMQTWYCPQCRAWVPGWAPPGPMSERECEGCRDRRVGVAVRLLASIFTPGESK